MSNTDGPKREEPNRLLSTFQETLDTHGYGFQYSVIKEVERLYTQKRYTWYLEQAEFPVEVRGRDTRIDIVLGRMPDSSLVTCEQYILAECKRANPAYSDWCFIRAPYTGRGTTAGYVIADKAQRVYENYVTIATWKQYMGAQDYSAYHIAVEVKSDRKGDKGGSAKGGIEEAVTQVLRGLNGMLEYVAKHPSIFPSSNHMLFLPVIFTTAHLWVSDADLSLASLETGTIDLMSSEFKEVDWLLYEYNMSPGLKHTQAFAGSDGSQSTLSKANEALNVRTIAIVGPVGIAKYLDWAHQFEILR